MSVLNDNDRTLVLAPHADDEILGCGGTMSRCIAEGAEVHVAILTNASRGMPEVFSEAESNAIREEARRAHALLGISSTRFYDLPAPKLDVIPSADIASMLRTLIAEICPQNVYVPHIGDAHQDHNMVHISALVATRPVDEHVVKNVYAYEVLSETEWGTATTPFIPNHYIDISDHIDQKLRAFSCFKSQIKPPPHPRSLEVIRAQASVRGSTVLIPYAEAFQSVRTIS